MADKIKVAVRVRPFSRREEELETECAVEMVENQTVLCYPGVQRGKQPKTFAFDHCFWSTVVTDSHYADQAQVYESLGTDVLENAFQGYNACIFAYGQTGSGKSYTMMGSAGDKRGVIPRLCERLFERIGESETSSLIFKVEASYMEIYNEKVRDLLDPKGSKHNLRVREHNILGPYVDGLSTLAVSSFEQIESLMEEGNKSRTVAATNMNSESSRSHAVFNIKLTQTLIDMEAGVSGEKVSKVSLVDLAGSERVLKSGAVGKRLEEGANINRSLTTLGMVISALADQSSGHHGRGSAGGGRSKFVPYRDSVLTWLLKDNLGGNSKTVMIATISPAADNFDETLSTLRYADRAKRIVNHAVVNEDPNAKIIRELRAELEALRAQIKDQNQAEDLRERLAESEKLMSDITRSWEERLKETERIHQSRQQEFERMGIQIGSSGIKVSEGKFHLVNLNADPSMNELLVYYLKERTVIGRAANSQSPEHVQPDIILQGLGVQAKHAVFSIETNQLWIEPAEDARTCVNGSVIISKTALRNGDRILVGNNHFFRVNCPKESGSSMVTSSSSSEFGSTDKLMGKTPPIIDYDFALQEIFKHDKESDTIAMAVAEIERQHQMDKEEALERQRKIFEEQIQNLRQNQWSPQTPMDSWGRPHTPSHPLYLNTPGLTPSTPYPASRGSRVKDEYDRWIRDRDEMFKTSLSRLKEDIVRANSLMREANLMAADMGKQTQFSVTLQIPAENLTPSKIKKGAFVSEPAILVKRKGKGSQVWSMEKLENKLIDMRELYEDWKDRGEEEQAAMARELDPFFESQESHSLIGVANAFLEVLFHDVRLDYQVPIISQQGEVAGRLHVEIYRLKSSTEESTDQDSDSISVSSESSDVPSDYGRKMRCRVRIKEATGLPPPLSHFVFCQYAFWSYPEPVVVPPIFDPNQETSNEVHQPQGLTFTFEHERDFSVAVTDEFVEHLHDGALSIEVWGHKIGPSICLIGERGSDVERLQISKTKSLQERWAEVTRRVKLWVEILEMNDNGQYGPVEVQKAPDLYTGGVYQLKQGQQRRISVSVQVDKEFGLLPLVCQQISSVGVGCICGRNRSIQKPLDSYQEADLDMLKEQWDKALQERRSYLEDQIQKLMKKPDKNEDDVEREQALISQWFALTEERNAVYIPAPNSNIPGAPADWDPPSGIESHIPVIFLNVDQEDINNTAQCAGVHSILPKEHSGKLFNLPVRHQNEPQEHGEVHAVATWDSSIHEHVAINRVTPSHERVYAILKVVVMLSHPAEMELVLRKRLCFNIYKKPSFAKMLVDRFIKSDGPAGTGVLYDLVAHVPKSSLDPEDRSTLALMAAKGEETGSDGETYIEKYTKGISVVESILALDRLRQEVVIRDLLAKQGKKRPGASIKRAASMPNAINAPLLGGHRPSADAAMILSEKSEERPMLVTSLVSPNTMSGSGKLLPPRSTMAAVQEELQINKNGQAEPQEVTANVHATARDRKTPMRQSTTCDSLACDSQTNADRNNSMGSSSSSGYGSQVLSTRSEESVDGILSSATVTAEEGRVSADQDSDATVVATPAETPGITRDRRSEERSANNNSEFAEENGAESTEFGVLGSDGTTNQRTLELTEDEQFEERNGNNNSEFAEPMDRLEENGAESTGLRVDSDIVETDLELTEDEWTEQRAGNNYSEFTNLMERLEENGAVSTELGVNSDGDGMSCDRALELTEDDSDILESGGTSLDKTLQLTEDEQTEFEGKETQLNDDRLTEDDEIDDGGVNDDGSGESRCQWSDEGKNLEFVENNGNNNAEDLEMADNDWMKTDSENGAQENAHGYYGNSANNQTEGDQNGLEQNGKQRSCEILTEGFLSPGTTSQSLSVKGMELSSYSDYGAKLLDVSTASSQPENSSELVSSRDDSLAGEDILSSQESIEDSGVGALIPDWLAVNCAVFVLPDKRPGTVRYVGPTEFASGIWVGIELDSPNGKNSPNSLKCSRMGCLGDSDGEHDGVRYFSCEKEFGVFVRMNLVSPNSVGGKKTEHDSNNCSLENAQNGEENVWEEKKKNLRLKSSEKRVPTFNKPTTSSAAKTQRKQ